MTDLHCRWCGHDEFEYLGISDGGGDYGDALTEDYECLNCGNITETIVGYDAPSFIYIDDEMPVIDQAHQLPSDYDNGDDIPF